MPPLDQNQYVHAMAEDTATGKPMPKVSIAGADSSSGALGVDVKASQIIVPTDVQSRYSKTIQTHSGTVVAPSGWNQGPWIDCDGFDKLAFNFKNDGTTSSDIYIDWSTDGTNAGQAGVDAVVTGNTQQYRSGIVDIKLRYARIALKNNDAAPHTMSAWAFLKC
jgi:hypothetical protein